MDDRRCSLSIWLMAQEAIRKAVLYHHQQLAPADIEMQSDLRSTICTKIRDHPGGTFSIRTRNSTDVPARSLQTVVAYRAPAAPGTRREAREQRRREAREARRHASLARGDYTPSLTFFSYDTDVSEDEPSEAEEALAYGASVAPRRRRVKRSLIRRISYYPPRGSETRQIRLDFVNLEHGADFTPPLNQEEFEETGASSGMDSDFQEDHEDSPPPCRPSTLPTREAIQNVMNGLAEAEVHLEFSPTTAARDLVQSLSMATPPPLAAPQGAAAAVWGLGLGAVGGSAPIARPPDADAAAMWRATEAAWDAVLAPVPAPAPVQSVQQPAFVLHHAPDHILVEDEDFDPVVQRMTPHISDQERLGEGAVLNAIFGRRQRAPRPLHPMAMADFLGGAWAAAAAATPARSRTPAPVLAPVAPAAAPLLRQLCAAMISSGRYPEHVVAAYLAEREEAGGAPPSADIAHYDSLIFATERAQYRELHAAVERTLDMMGWRPEAATPPVAPAPEAPERPSTSSILEDMPLVETSDEFPPTFTNRARMKRQRQAREATAAATAATHAAHAAHAAAQQAAVAAAQQQTQQMTDETMSVAGPSSLALSSLDEHERRKARRVVAATIDDAITAALTTSSVLTGATPVSAAEAPAPTQRVLGAVPQQLQSHQRLAAAAAAAATAAAHPQLSSVHASSCPCVYCPSGGAHRHRLPPPSSAPSSSVSLPPSYLSQFALDDPVRSILTPEVTASILDLERTQQQHNSIFLFSMLQAQQQQQRQRQVQQLQQQQQQIDALRRLQQQQQSQILNPLHVDLQQLQQRQHLQRVPTPATTTPVFPRMETLPYFYSTPMSYLNPQPSLVPAPPLPFVDLPDSNPVLTRTHMFNAQAASTLVAAAAAASSAVTTDPTSGTPTTDQVVQQLMQQHMHSDAARRDLHALREYISATMPQSGEAAPVGAPQRDIEKFARPQHWTAQQDADVDPCTVCMSEFEEGDEFRRLPCQHSFHKPCIDRWLSYNKKCPNCRVDLDHQSSAAAAAASEPAAAAPAPALNVAEETPGTFSMRIGNGLFTENFRPEVERLQALAAAYEDELIYHPSQAL